MRCPVCHVPMFVMESLEIELDRCAECAGTWFDRDELALLFTDETGNVLPQLAAHEIQELPDAAVDEPPKRCPICGRKMRKVNIGPSARVLVDACSRGHGIWFDDREVEDLAKDLLNNLPASFTGFSVLVLDFLGRSCGGVESHRKEGDKV